MTRICEYGMSENVENCATRGARVIAMGDTKREVTDNEKVMEVYVFKPRLLGLLL